MTNAELAFSQRDITLKPRTFSIEDGLSRLFDVHVTAGSSSPDIDLEALVGHGAAFRLSLGVDALRGARAYAVWSGVCSDMEQVSVEENGESLYLIRIRPMLWRTTQRRNFRVLQHVTAAEAVAKLLEEWDMVAELGMDPGSLPRREYRVQFGESDFAFMSRMLEEAGITYSFVQVDGRGEGPGPAGHPHPGPESMKLVLSDAPGSTGPRIETPIAYRGHVDDIRSALPHVRNVRLGRSVRPGRYTLAGYDYQASRELRLLVEARTRAELERRYEQLHYLPGAFLEEPRERAGRGQPRSTEELGKREARIGLERDVSRQRHISFDTNQLGLAPGCAFSMIGHPRAELGRKANVMVTSRSITGETDGEWSIQADACFAADPYRPTLSTPKPRVMGIQSALVVGPKGEEIYTDALGRVKVQFHWDRYGQRDENSSCWMRVSQGWAGSGYGMSAIPRIGHEVLVDFLEGDPDQPVVVGRAYNRGAVPPDRLPEQKTRTTWRSQSSPGGEGFNEISMDDARGRELLFVRAQKNLERQVLVDEKASIGRNLTAVVTADEHRTVGKNQSIKVGGNRALDVDGQHTSRADGGMQTQAGERTGISCVDGKLIISNGSASIVLDGPNVHIDAAANLRMSAGAQLGLYGREVAMDAAPDVFINSARAVPPQVAQLPVVARAEEDRARAGRGRRQEQPRGRDGMPIRPEGIDEAELARRRGYGEVRRGRALPERMRLPRPVDQQLGRQRRAAGRGGTVRGRVLHPDTYISVKDRVSRRLQGEQVRLERLGTDLNGIFEHQRTHVADLGKRLDERLLVEREGLAKLGDEIGAVFSGERGNLIDSSKALFGAFKDEVSRVNQLKKDITAMLDREKGYLAQFKGEWQGYAAQVQGTIDDIKHLVEDPRDAAMDMLLGDGWDGSGGRAPGREVPGRGTGGAPPRPPGDRPAAEPPARPGHREPGSLTGRAEKRRLPTTQQGDSRDAGGSAARGASLKRAPGAPVARAPGSETPSLRPGGRAQMSAAPTAVEPRPELASHAQARRMPNAELGGAQQMSGTFAQGQNASLDARAASTQFGASASGASSASGEPAAAAGRQGVQTPIELETAGSAVTKDGAIAAHDVTTALEGEAPHFIQSESEGTLMVVPTEAAQHVDASELSTAMVDAQMAGRPAGDGIAQTLSAKGYAVYQRGWSDWFGELVRYAGAQA